MVCGLAKSFSTCSDLSSPFAQWQLKKVINLFQKLSLLYWTASARKYTKYLILTGEMSKASVSCAMVKFPRGVVEFRIVLLVLCEDQQELA